MWIGSIKWNFIIAGIISAFTFLFSILNNLFLESLLRSLLAFVLFFLFVFIFRYLISKVIGKENKHLLTREEKGQHIDLVTPEESAQQQSEELERRQGKPAFEEFSQFTPADFPQIARNRKDDIDPEEVARALRVFSNE
ncbi:MULTISPECIES: hypothetical protein [Aneurinibacillus]|jgi:flagellar biosynthesis/type III secretory pathway M-ring protein FliF/YscJ|uniref:Uncharacterized protein n=1 Tax=Aneurinibacillus danicus TaxID=267746 RepID=A0A511V3W2_9BACL|nr:MULTISPECIES: hypothetical protein [Aneurinibacillus]GEN33615.1 hypothetical protein ADA01nite_10750 [Aneurinibacillus danicus]